MRALLTCLLVVSGCSQPAQLDVYGSPRGDGSDASATSDATAEVIAPDGAPAVADVGEPTTDMSPPPTPDSGVAPDVDAGIDMSPPEPPPNLEALFTDPVGDAPDLTLEQALTELLDSAPPGASVRVAFFTWTRRPMAEAVVDTYQRGVDVRVVVGNTNVNAEGELNGAVTILREALGDRLTICDEGEPSGGCMGTGINHNKFVLFSELDDGSTDVVWQSSANLTNPQLRAFNNAVIIRNDPELYAAYLSYWTDLQADQTNLDYYHSVNGTLRTKAYFYPRESGDTILGILDNVHCDQGARIRIAMAFFTNPRVAIAERLRAMAADGCDVAVNVQGGDLLGANVVDQLTHPEIELLVYPDDASPHIHSKYLLIDGAYGANATQQRLVWTGSHNYTGPALRSNDEVLLKVRDDAIFAAFEADWTNIRDRAPP